MARDTATQDRTSVAELRETKLALDRAPTTWCPGCGDGIILQALLSAFTELGLGREVALVAGIGCFGHAGEYVKYDFFHALHGRALPTATGLKLARPDLKVVALVGDGDGLAIGGNHFIHAARRNIDLTVIMFNNAVYGRTGGQYSPTTAFGATLQTAPYGMVEPQFDPCEVALGSGASFVSRITVYHARQMAKMFVEALTHPGLSFVEVITNCHVMFGRYNDMETASEMILGYRDRAVSVHQTKNIPAAELRDRIVIGNLRNERRTELSAEYEKQRQSVAAAAANAAAKAEPESHAEPAPAPAKKIGRREVVFGGTGGQGLQLAGTIFTEAAGIIEGYHAVQVQDYGPAIRGGVSTSEVVLSDTEVLHPRADRPDMAVALSQQAVDYCAEHLRPGGFIIYDPLFVSSVPDSVRCYAVPATQIAETLGRRVVANIVALGALARLTDIPSLAAIESALLKRVPKGTDTLNRSALLAGYNSVEP